MLGQMSAISPFSNDTTEESPVDSGTEVDTAAAPPWAHASEPTAV